MSPQPLPISGRSPRSGNALHRLALLFALAATAPILLAPILLAQDPPPQTTTSLGDVARQTRAQKPASTQGEPSKAQELADQLQQEQEESDNAPIGFRTYNAGDYRLYVPFPYSLEGSDGTGTVLVGSRIGVTNTEVMVGNPMPIPAYYGDLNDNNVARNLVRQLAQRYGQYPGCGLAKLADHRAFKCSLSSFHLLGHQVVGTMLFVITANSLIPVMCVSPDDMNENQVFANPRATYKQKQEAMAHQQQRFQDERTTAQVCDQTIYPSIRLREDDAHRAVTAANPNDAMVHPDPAAAKGLAATPNPTAALVPSAAARHDPPATGTSVADLARLAKENAVQPARTHVSLDASGERLAPKGYKTLSFNYCQTDGSCWEASVFVPVNAILLNDYYSEYVLETPLGDGKFLLFAGPAGVGAPGRLGSDPVLIRWEEMNDPEGWVGRGRVRAIRHEQATVAGRPGILTHFEINRNGTIWIGARAKVERHGVAVLVGCMAPQDRFADADETCTTLIDSLRLP